MRAASLVVIVITFIARPNAQYVSTSPMGLESARQRQRMIHAASRCSTAPSQVKSSLYSPKCKKAQGKSNARGLLAQIGLSSLRTGPMPMRKAISDCRTAVQLARGRQLPTETFCLKYRQLKISSQGLACIASDFSSSHPPPPPPLTSLQSPLPPSPPPLSPSPPSPPLAAELSPRHQKSTKWAIEKKKL